MREISIEKDKKMLSELKNVILLILTVIDLVFIFLSTVYSFNFKVDGYFADYDFLVCVLLFIDLAYDFYCSEKNFKEYFISDKQILSLLSLLPFDLLFRYFSIFRLFRFLKIIKMVRVWHVIRDIDSLFYFIEYHMLKMLFIILMVYVGISSVLFIMLDDSVTNLSDALWYIVITISTVGFGDITPLSPIGRALSILTIIIGTIVIAIFTAYLSARYNERPEKETREMIRKDVLSVEKSNKKLQEEVNELNNEISKLNKKNKDLSNQLNQINEKLDEISDKL